MIYNLDNPWEVQKIKEHLSSLLKKGGMAELKRKSPQRSLAQNRYLYLCLGYFGCEYGVSAEEAKIDYYKRLCNKDLYERETTNKFGKVVKYLRSTADLTTAEMNLSIERFRNWSASVAGIYIPSPNEEQFLAYCEQQIENNREFI